MSKNKKKLKKPKVFRSKLEEKFALSLQKSNVSFKYEKTTLPFIQPEVKRKYLIDFTIKTKDGLIYVETKGRFTLEDRKKHILIKEQYPNLEIILVFQRDQPIHKGSKTKYSDWCKKFGFKYYIGIEEFMNNV
jgi:hypothetical protein